MNIINQARERVCKSLINRVEYYDELLSESNIETEKEKIEKLYIYQVRLINRLENVLNH